MARLQMAEEKPTSKNSNLAARVLPLAELIDYQDGSVVSRQILGATGGTVTLFAFAEGEGLSEHTAPFDALVYILDGEAEVVLSGKALRLTQGEMLIMPAGQTHSLRATRAFKMMLVMIR